MERGDPVFRQIVGISHFEGYTVFRVDVGGPVIRKIFVSKREEDGREFQSLRAVNGEYANAVGCRIKRSLPLRLMFTDEQFQSLDEIIKGPVPLLLKLTDDTKQFPDIRERLTSRGKSGHRSLPTGLEKY